MGKRQGWGQAKAAAHGVDQQGPWPCMDTPLKQLAKGLNASELSFNRAPGPWVGGMESRVGLLRVVNSR